MKLKPLPPRLNHILIHTHTVSGITISFVLFVIFYCGAFALFRHDIYQWENQEARGVVVEQVELGQAIASVADYDPQFDPSEVFTLGMPSDPVPYLSFYGAAYADTARTQTERFHYLLDTGNDYQLAADGHEKTTLGDTIYHLHYLGQLPLGLYLSGFVSLFFLFATATGILIHWKSLITRFYAFTTEGKWKLIWKNAHTVLGVIGLPFQVMYAITGALFGLLTLLLIPSAFVLFGGDTDKVLATVRPGSAIEADEEAPAAAMNDLEQCYAEVRQAYPGYEVGAVRLRNYGKKDALATFYVDDGMTINGTGEITYRITDREVMVQVAPDKKTYTQSVLNALTKLHFATFGGFGLKVLYFILSMITCFMLLAGVLLWYEARNNNRYTDQQRRFQHKVTKWYLAICLSLFPATALIFIANKLVPISMDGRVIYVNTIFFIGWLLMTLIGLRWNHFGRLNRNYLVLGGALSLLVPIANGAVTGDWVWTTLRAAQWYVFSVDVFWVVCGAVALIAARQLNGTAKPKVVSVDREHEYQPAVKVSAAVDADE